MPYEVVRKDLEELLTTWAEECEEDRFHEYQKFMDETRAEVAELFERNDEESLGVLKVIALKMANRKEGILGVFNQEDVAKALSHYLNSEAPGTWSLVCMQRIEFPGLDTIKNVGYEFVWRKPE